MTRHQKYNINEGRAAYHKEQTKGEGTATLEIQSSVVSSVASSKTPITEPTLGVAAPQLVDDGKFHWTWIPLVMAGIAALAFLVCMWGISTSPAHLRGVGHVPWKGDGELEQQGRLMIYPRIEGVYNDSHFPNQHFISMDETDFLHNYELIRTLTNTYPQHSSDSPPPDPYVHCWLELPSSGHPCFYDRGWFGRACNDSNRFGYDRNAHEYQPCFLVRLEDSGSWIPKNIKRDQVKEIHRPHFDASFISFHCRAERYGDRNKLSFDHFPVKGFPLAFFPMDQFSEEYYLNPAVMVQINGLRKGVNTTIHCWLRSPNSYFLEDSGIIKISFLWSPQGGYLQGGQEERLRGETTTTMEKASTKPRSIQQTITEDTTTEPSTTIGTTPEVFPFIS